MTNIALALKTFPEIKDNIKDIFIMGGNHKGKCEISPIDIYDLIKMNWLISMVLGRGNVVAGAEFNFHADPIAAHIVLNTLKCPMIILTLECGLPGSISIPLV